MIKIYTRFIIVYVREGKTRIEHAQTRPEMYEIFYELESVSEKIMIFRYNSETEIYEEMEV